MCWRNTSCVSSVGSSTGIIGAGADDARSITSAVALMVWLYWTGFAMLVGAELNAELAKRTEAGAIEQMPEPPAVTKLDLTGT